MSVNALKSRGLPRVVHDTEPVRLAARGRGSWESRDVIKHCIGTNTSHTVAAVNRGGDLPQLQIVATTVTLVVDSSCHE